ncbi:MAG: SagB/ThcOx family dehydrogenase [Bryobacteraceae bacterium]
MFRSDDFTSLSLLYHWNSLPRAVPESLHTREYREHVDGIALPDSEVTTSELDRLIRERRSCRDFESSPLDRHFIGRLLANAACVPSAGYLHPLEIYAISTEGISHYNPRDHSTEVRCARPAPGVLKSAYLGQPWVEAAGLVVVITSVFRRNQKKYGPRGYRYALLQAGHAAQNICLTAGELGLGSVCLGGFDDRKLNRILGVNGREEAALYSVAVGHPLDRP